MSQVETKSLYPFGLLSPESQEVLQRAVEEAVSFGNGYYIDTVDLLVGLTLVGKVGKKLQESGVTPERIREAKNKLDGYVQRKQVEPPLEPLSIQAWEQIPRTFRVQKIGSLVNRKTFIEKKEVVNPEDILEIIIRERENIGARIIKMLTLG